MDFQEIISDWLEDIIDKFMDNLPKSIFSLFLIPFIIWAMTGAILDFSFFAAIGYISYCLVNLGKILEKIERALSYGVAYVIGTILFDTFITSVWPLMKGDGASIFSALVLTYVLASLYFKKEELKK